MRIRGLYTPIKQDDISYDLTDRLVSLCLLASAQVDQSQGIFSADSESLYEVRKGRSSYTWF